MIVSRILLTALLALAGLLSLDGAVAEVPRATNEVLATADCVAWPDGGRVDGTRPGGDARHPCPGHDEPACESTCDACVAATAGVSSLATLPRLTVWPAAHGGLAAPQSTGTRLDRPPRR